MTEIPDLRMHKLRDAVCADLALAAKLIREDRSILEARGGCGETALHFLVVENEQQAVEFLRSQGAKIDTKNDFGDTPLIDASSLGYLQMCQYLVAHGASFRHISSQNGNSAFSQAASSDKTEILSYLLSLLAPEEDVNDFFGDAEAEIVLNYHQSSAQLLTQRGLKRRWPDEYI